MTIRYECEQCGSVLKIKDELAGTNGKCPKCKAKFIVPEPDAAGEHEEQDDLAESVAPPAAPEKAAAKPDKPAPKPAPPAKSAKPSKNEDDFDPADFLMEANDGPIKSAPEPTPGRPGPGGARPIAPPPSGGGRASQENSAAAAASAMMGGNAASANARDLLSKAAEDSRIRQATLPEEDTGPKYDFSMLRGQLQEMAPRIIGVVVALPVLFYISLSMFSDNLPLPQLAEVTGTVLMNGQPMKDLKVMLSPVTPDAKDTNGDDIKLRTSVGVTDENGIFEIEYMPGVNGAPLGKMKVSMEPLDGSMEVYRKIPPSYLPDSPAAIVSEVKEVGNGERFTFDLKSP